MTTQIYLSSRPIDGYGAIFRHHFITIRHPDEDAAKQFEAWSSAWLAHSRLKSVGHDTLSNGWIVSTIEGNCMKDAGGHGVLATYAEDGDDIKQLNAGIAYAQTFPHPTDGTHAVVLELSASECSTRDAPDPGLALAKMLVTCWDRYDRNLFDPNGCGRIAYSDCGPNCITFAMGVLQACGFSYSYLKPLDDRVGLGFNAGADLTIDPSYFAEPGHYGAEIHDGGLPRTSCTGPICTDADLYSHDHGNITLPAIVCLGTLNIRALTGSTVALSAVEAAKAVIENGHASTVVATTANVPQVEAQVYDFSTLEIRDASKIAALSGTLKDTSTATTPGFKGSGGFDVQTCSTWNH